MKQDEIHIRYIPEPASQALPLADQNTDKEKFKSRPDSVSYPVTTRDCENQSDV